MKVSVDFSTAEAAVVLVLATGVPKSTCFVNINFFTSNMRWLLPFLFSVLSLVQALSSTGNRLLVVVEDAAEKAKYSTFWGDLECKFNSAAFTMISMELF